MRVASVSRFVQRALIYILSVFTGSLICLWLLVLVYDLAYNTQLEYRRTSMARGSSTLYIFGVTATDLYFIRFINCPSGSPPPNQTGIVSMGHMLEEKDFYLGQWSHDFRDAFYSPHPAATYTDGMDLSPCTRVIEHDRKILFLSFWPILAIVAFLPALTFLTRARRAYISRRAFRLTHCHHCGYDLRATPNRCPECGTSRTA